MKKTLILLYMCGICISNSAPESNHRDISVYYSDIPGKKIISTEHHTLKEQGGITKKHDIYIIKKIWIDPNLRKSINQETSWILLENNQGAKIKIFFHPYMLIDGGHGFYIGRSIQIFFDNQGNLVNYIFSDQNQEN